LIPKILIIGANGQLGSELAPALRARLGVEQVVTADLRLPETVQGPAELLDVTHRDKLEAIVAKHGINQIYLLAALLSATGEQNPQLAWNVNMQGLLHVLEVARERKLTRVFWPSSIAAFGPHTPKNPTPQYCVMDPTSMYGITKLSGELLCQYYYQKFGVDVRSIRYPGLISWQSPPGGGTTDYAIHIFHEALKHNRYTCFLSADTALPMMYMPDAIRGTIALMEAPAEKLTIRTSYNLAAVSFTPAQLAAEIRVHLPGFEINYAPDFRQAIADSWPAAIDDSAARNDWNWEPEFGIEKMTQDMLVNIRQAFKY
jgi:nucleoside-diphosphate-sugar epimerase